MGSYAEHRRIGPTRDDCKYIRYAGQGYPVAAEQLYDLRTDPHERINQAANPAYRGELDRLAAC